MTSRIKETELQVWEEIIGDCIRFEVKENKVVVVFRCCNCMRITFPLNSNEGIILRGLGRKLVGQKLEMLRTDIPSKAIVVRPGTYETTKSEG